MYQGNVCIIISEDAFLTKWRTHAHLLILFFETKIDMRLILKCLLVEWF